MNDQIRRAMIKEGWIIPITPDEVELAEAIDDQDSMPLPASLADPSAILAGRPREIKRFAAASPTPMNDCVAQELARAAREGKEIPPDVEARMRADRETAERDGEE